MKKLKIENEIKWLNGFILETAYKNIIYILQNNIYINLYI